MVNSSKGLRGICSLSCAVLLAASAPAVAASYAIDNVSLVDVETGTHRTGQTVVIDGTTIQAIGQRAAVAIPEGSQRIDGRGKFLIPGLWDMHVHSHRERRWTYHYPLFRAWGVVGVRDAGSHLGSALAARERAVADPLAPHVIWGSPIIDGAPQINSFGLSAEDEQSGRVLVREMQRMGFDFIKVYDRLTPEAYRGIAAEAKTRGMRLEGHVPLSISPDAAVNAGQTLIDHLTLVMEACIPGAIKLVNSEQAAKPETVDSLALIADARMAAALGHYDPAVCDAQFSQFAAKDVWQVPTLIQMKGYFFADQLAVAIDPRSDQVPANVLAEWQSRGREADRAELANGREALAAQMRMFRAMQDRGVKLLTGTDTSNEPWVFAGSSVHDELLLFVESGLAPAEALRAATLNPRLYQGRDTAVPLLAAGERADLVLLDADPLVDISNTRRIAGVFARGSYHDRTSIGQLLAAARQAAAKGQ